VRHKKPENFLGAVARNGHGMASEDALTPHDRAVEALLMGLRLGEGVDLARIAALAGGTAPLDAPALDRIVAQGLAERLVARDGHRLRVSEAGMPVLEAILRAIVV
jgi:coproporphyrinogen III oxidase-like Fe-S oxidoreductase